LFVGGAGFVLEFALHDEAFAGLVVDQEQVGAPILADDRFADRHLAIHPQATVFEILEHITRNHDGVFVTGHGSSTICRRVASAATSNAPASSNRPRAIASASAHTSLPAK